MTVETKNSGFKTFLESEPFVYSDVNFNFELLDSMRLPKPFNGISNIVSSVTTSNAFSRVCEWRTIIYSDKTFESYGVIQVSGVTLPLPNILVPKPDGVDIKKLFTIGCNFNITSATSSTGSTIANSDIGVLAMPISDTASVNELGFKMIKVNCSDNLTVSGQLFITLRGEIQ